MDTYEYEYDMYDTDTKDSIISYSVLLKTSYAYRSKTKQSRKALQPAEGAFDKSRSSVH